MQSTNSPSVLSCCCTKPLKITRTTLLRRTKGGLGFPKGILEGWQHLERNLGGKMCAFIEV